MFSSKKSFLKPGNYINPNFFIQVVTSFPPLHSMCTYLKIFTAPQRFLKKTQQGFPNTKYI